MSNKKTKLEKIEGINQEIEQLKNRAKLLSQQHKAAERKARTKRLCSRHGLLEKFLPDLINITDEQFEAFIKTGIDTKYGRNKLAEIVAKGGATTAPKPAEAAMQYVPPPNAKPAVAAQDNGLGGEDARVGGEVPRA